VAYSQKAFERDVEGAIPSKHDRFLEKWPRPRPIAAGVTLAFRIVTPCSAVTSPMGAADRNAIWLPKRPPQRATEIDIMVISPTTPVSGWPGKNTMGTTPVGSYKLENGESVRVVYWVVDMPNLATATQGTGRFYRGRSKEDLQSDILRALVFGKEPDGSRVIDDCAVMGKGS
jgi:hypothetical protein